MPLNPLLEASILTFVLNIFRSELREDEGHFNYLDRLYSEFFFLQNELARFLYRIGDITKEERDRQWMEVDQQEAEWEERLAEWREKRFLLNKVLLQLRARLREIQSSGEVSRVAA